MIAVRNPIVSKYKFFNPTKVGKLCVIQLNVVNLVPEIGLRRPQAGTSVQAAVHRLPQAAAAAPRPGRPKRHRRKPQKQQIPMLNKLTAISPIDGRYRNVTEKLADYFSEQALIRYRIRVEVEYFIALCELPLPQLAEIDHTKFDALRALYRDFSPADVERVKEIEAVTNHDVKAVEYILKEKMDALGLERYKEFVHFGLTSQDIINPA